MTELQALVRMEGTGLEKNALALGEGLEFYFCKGSDTGGNLDRKL